ncbi:glycoside hydrolase family 53 protein [Flavobacterium lotistagni]|uniref:glycoside hydrolase family 53 protein n=1 Tax=Flavobacterium lotistagni TaxID=2709660 RepID=UPI001F2A5D6D|nr:glycosyl hydrolase 53 family protein [Flavobacterium lotistagni]
MKKIFFSFNILASMLLCSCAENEVSTPAASAKMTRPILVKSLIKSADVSYLPLIESEGTIYKNNNQPQDALLTLKRAGCNTIRIRLWKNPSDGHSGLAEVKTLALRARAMGFKIWLSVHYSDTWADPGSQTKPQEWANLNFEQLKAAVASYTTTVMSEIRPEIYQVGNETNDGFLFPQGKLSVNEGQYLQLVQSAVTVIRAQSSTTKIMLHYAGVSGASWYFNKVQNIDYDYIGLSYYPVWHGQDMNLLATTINSLSQTYQKKILIAETAYPFTLGWNDWTNNIVGLSNQLVPAYAATPTGQKNFMIAIRNLLLNSTNGIGFSYWGSEWVAFRGPQATNGSTFENQALWDFNLNALPVMDAFN